MRIAVIQLFVLFVIYLATCDAAVPQILKSQSLIPFPRVGRSRSAFIANAIGSSARGTMLNLGSNNNNKPSNWMNNVDLTVKRHLIPFPRVGKRQSLIPFPRVGRSRYFGQYPSRDDEAMQQQLAMSDEDFQAPALILSNDILGGVNNRRVHPDEQAVFIPRPWMTSQESDE
ncbi:uncharacterized protein LOC130702536 [Daphnia carinata]|uniref:uncharacterized protein LOC130702536 n=1 Tax=Daphnia carinata TaxID=120202 RepID=UPI00257B11E1|nr:uncharacterized protein LOC130702536 [Daphnia carinata]